jgi:hypothetical protein
MLGIVESLAVVKIVLFVIIISSACVYSAPILLIGRFRTSINILTINLCVSAIICSTYWIIFCILQVKSLDKPTGWNCLLLQYFQTFVNGQEIYSLCVISINRFCFILYNNKVLFRTRRWSYICIGSQWLIGMILPLVTFVMPEQVIFPFNLLQQKIFFAFSRFVVLWSRIPKFSLGLYSIH